MKTITKFKALKSIPLAIPSLGRSMNFLLSSEQFFRFLTASLTNQVIIYEKRVGQIEKNVGKAHKAMLILKFICVKINLLLKPASLNLNYKIDQNWPKKKQSFKVFRKDMFRVCPTLASLKFEPYIGSSSIPSFGPSHPHPLGNIANHSLRAWTAHGPCSTEHEAHERISLRLIFLVQAFATKQFHKKNSLPSLCKLKGLVPSTKL